MSEFFEVITKEEFDEDSGAVVWSVHDSSVASSEGNDEATAPELKYCEFCKGYYNEYHFGDIDEPSR